MNSMIVTRFAPSPTGHLHIGGARTALFSFLHAKHNNGKFLLRMEDTDMARSKTEFAESIVNDLKWLGLNWDNEEIPFQTQRMALYKPFEDFLIKKNFAYVNEGAIYLRGADDVEDFVILKSDGIPTFHFAVVIDDHLTGVTDVIRGVDHLTNTKKHLLIYKYLKLPAPKYFHVPLIVDENSQPLSKRRNDANVAYYKDNYYFPEAIINSLARMGWGYQNQEIFSIEELIRLFEIGKVTKSPAKLDLKKINWINAQYMKKANLADLEKFEFESVTKLIAKAKVDSHSQTLVGLLQQKAFGVKDLDDLCRPFVGNIEPQKPAQQEDADFILNNAEDILSVLNSIEDWSVIQIEQIMRNYINQKNIELKELAQVVRRALTNQDKSLDLFTLIFYVGKNEVVNRLRNVLNIIK